MKKLAVNYQKSSDKLWTDEAGNQTQYARLFSHEKLMEKHSAKLFKDAVRINKNLTTFKETVADICEKIYAQYLKDKQIDKIGQGKGNFTWYNFDRSLKIEVSINERITFDDMGIETCKQLLDEFLEENVDSKEQVIKEMVTDAFNTSRGKLDARKVMNLLRYEGKIKSQKFSKAMSILRDSIRRPSSKTYFRIWAKDETGDYQSIDLNFSSI